MTKTSLFLLLAALLCGQAAQAQNMTNSEFLKLPENKRHQWYAGAFMSLGRTAYLQDKEKGKCVWDWFFDNTEKRKQQLNKSVEQYLDHTPTNTVIALLRRDCGVFLSTRMDSASSGKTKSGRLPKGWQWVGEPCFVPPPLAGLD